MKLRLSLNLYLYFISEVFRNKKIFENRKSKIEKSKNIEIENIFQNLRNRKKNNLENRKTKIEKNFTKNWKINFCYMC